MGIEKVRPTVSLLLHREGKTWYRVTDTQFHWTSYVGMDEMNLIIYLSQYNLNHHILLSIPN